MNPAARRENPCGTCVVRYPVFAPVKKGDRTPPKTHENLFNDFPGVAEQLLQ